LAYDTDASSLAAFDHQFGALENKQDSFRDAIAKTRAQSFESSSKAAVFFQYIIEYLPAWMVYCLFRLPIKKFTLMFHLRDMVSSFADQLVKEKLHTYQQGLQGSKDLMTLLVRANAMEKQVNRLTDAEVNSEIVTITFAGQGTSANTMAFCLLELGKNIDMQRRVRQDILDIKQQNAGSDDPDIYDNMTLLNALIKEVLRYHAVAFNINRDAVKDSVLPLSKPITLRSGKVVNELPVAKGQKVLINVCGYNMLPELFGPDVDQFNIDRWLDGSSKDENRTQGVGVHSNLMTFGHGTRACIGWRFALWEIRAIIAELLIHFEFASPPDNRMVRRAQGLAMAPVASDTRGTAPSIPLMVSILQN